MAIGEWAVVLWLFSSGCCPVASLANETVTTGVASNEVAKDVWLVVKQWLWPVQEEDRTKWL